MLKLPNVQRRRRLPKRQLKSVFAMLQTLSRLLYLVQCTKKRDARAKLLFCQFKPTAFFAVLMAVAIVLA